MKEDALFCAKALLKASNEFKKRFIVCVGSALLAKYCSGKEWTRSYYCKIAQKPYVIVDIMCAYFVINDCKKVNMTNGMREGFKKAFNQFTDDDIDCCNSNGRPYSLLDVVNLVRPIPTEQNKKSLSRLCKGEDNILHKLYKFDSYLAEPVVYEGSRQSLVEDIDAIQI